MLAKLHTGLRAPALRPAVAAGLTFLCAAALFAQSAAPSNARMDGVLSRLEGAHAIFETALSPDGRKIAWVTGDDNGAAIEVASTSAPATAHRLTNDSGCVENNLSWSPDSKELAFTSDCGGGVQFDIYLAAIAGDPIRVSVPRQMTHLHGEVSNLAFSPDGKQIGFLYVEGATRRAGALDAMKPASGVIGEEGFEVQRIATADAASGEVRQITPSSLHIYEFDWAPDSRQLVYVAAPPPGENNWWVAKLYTQPLSQAEPHAIFDPNPHPGAPAHGPLEGMQIAVPRWSPDGKTIAFIGGLMSDQGSTGGDIYTVPSTGGDPHLLSTGAMAKISVAWIHWADAQRSGLLLRLRRLERLWGGAAW